MEEDEEEIRYYASPRRSDSPDPYSSPPPSGRNTVTVASSPPFFKNHDALAPSLLPFQISDGVGGSSRSNVGTFFSGGGIWSDGATEVLIDAWRKRYLKLNGGILKHKHWQEVMEIVNSSGEGNGKTDAQCRNKIDTVKRKYKQEKERIAYEGGRSNWGFFDILDRLLGSNPAKAKMPISPHGGGASHRGGGVGSSLYHHQQGKAAATRFRNPDSLDGVASDSYGGGGGGGGGSRNVPMGIPMSERDNSLGRQGRMVSQEPQGLVFRRCSESKRLGYGLDSEYDAAAMLDDSSDNLPPPPPKRLKMEKKKREREGGGEGSNSKWRELTRAITSLGEAYLETENAKMRQVVEIERARMEFMKEMESQRMQLFQKTILELSRLREQRERRIENAANDHQSYNATVNKHNNNNNNNNDDDDDDDDDDVGN